MKIRLLTFLVLSQHGLACKYRIISHLSIHDWMQNCIFWYFWYCVFRFLRSDYNSYDISTCCGKSDGLWHDVLRAVSTVQIAILRRTSSGEKSNVEEKRYGSW